jgi:hypothetical protein
MSSMISRNWYCVGQIGTTAPDEATAQAQMEAAIAAIRTALAPLTPQVWFSAEQSDGQLVLSIN